MRVSLSWVKEYIQLDQSPAEIAEMLTMAGLEVDAIETVYLQTQGVVVGRVTGVERHPNADKLVVAKVFDGAKEHQVVCGASNCREGLKTAFAPVGALIREDDGSDFEIKQVKLRGVESHGMLCSARELRINDEHDGILELNGDVPEGSEIAHLYPETVFDVSLTPNLGHCSSILGIVRELAAITDQKYTVPTGTPTETETLRVEDNAKVTINKYEACPRYACRFIKGVKVGSSPIWLQRKLEFLGLRSVNNVVDVTNFVMMELGHPLHAFDYDKLHGHEIVVGCCPEGEVFTTLDNKHRTLGKDTLMICDKDRPVAIAGVMGGLESEVGDSTVNILLESAYFNPSHIHRASKRFALQTDSSKRFERGADPNNVIKALGRAADLIQVLAGGDVAKGVLDVKKENFEPKIVPCRISRVGEILGVHVSGSEIESIFQRLCFPYQVRDQDTLSLIVPTYRNDISSEIDLIEEVARIYGYDNFRCEHVEYEGSVISHAPIFLFERSIRSRLIAEGLQEVLTCDLISPELVALVEKSEIEEESVIRVMNPTSFDQSVLRPSLLPGLLQLVKHNYDRQNQNLSGFEVGRIHFKDGDQYKEQSAAGIVLTGHYRPHHWEHKPDEVDFYDIKGIIENTLEAIGIERPLFKPGNLNIFHPGRQAAIEIDGSTVGIVGEIHPAIMRHFDISPKVLYAELNLHDLIQIVQPARAFVSIPQYPSSSRDWTLTLKESIAVAEVLGAIHSIDSSILEVVLLLDVYRSGSLGDDRKNVTFRFKYRDKNKTISQQEVDAEHARITEETLRLVGKAVI